MEYLQEGRALVDIIIIDINISVISVSNNNGDKQCDVLNLAEFACCNTLCTHLSTF